MKTIKAYGITMVEDNKRLLNDFQGRLAYTTKKKAKEVATQWGVPENVVELKIIIKQ